VRYFISKIAGNSPGFIEIDAIEYDQIKEARKNLLEVLFLEEKLDLVTENFYEYESELLSIASRMMIFHNEDHFSMSRERNVINRRIVNLMSACRMYLDQSIHHIANVYGKDSYKIEVIKTERSLHYDQNLSYRVMEALRNYIQHRGAPLYSIQFSYQRIDQGDNFQLLHTVLPLVSISALSDDGKFKRSIVEELKSIKKEDTFDIRPLIRDYVEIIGLIHEKTREVIGPDLTSWEDMLNNTIHKFQKEFSLDIPLTSLDIIAKDENNHWQERKAILRNFIERRRVLEKKNRSFNNLHKTYVSNEIRENDA
jgi:hypothetical protein